MKRGLLVLALMGLLVTPAMAGLAATPFAGQVNLATYNAQTGVLTMGQSNPRGVPIYADLTTVGSYLNQGTSSTYPLPVGDDIHATGGGTVTSFVVGYYIPTSSGTGPFTVSYSFWGGTPTDTGPFPGYGAPFLGGYNVGGLNPGAWAVNITGVSVPVGADFYIEQDFAGNGILNGGPLITGNAGGTVGYSNSYFTQTGSLWTLSIWADFYHSVSIPEPATLALFGMGVLVLVRRRR